MVHGFFLSASRVMKPADAVQPQVYGRLDGRSNSKILWAGCVPACCYNPGMNLSWLLVCCAPALIAQTVTGAVDLHVHADPDSMPRSIDAIDAARAARSRGMRALLLKNHYEPTASLAYLVRKEVPGIEIFGGIALNRSVGGVNPAAVERLARVKGQLTRAVWMPTFDSENQVRQSREQRPFVSVAKNGALLPEVLEVLSIIARNHWMLATGHSSPEENLLLVREAKRQAIDRILVTHAMLAPVGMSIPQMQQAASMGAYIEFVYNALLAPANIKLDEYVRAIRAVGPAHCVLSSDLGQAGNPLHADGLASYFSGLRAKGFTEAEIDVMGKTNPGRLLGLNE
jgi:hypothetical protein